mgnify:CR=1 FL=1
MWQLLSSPTTPKHNVNVVLSSCQVGPKFYVRSDTKSKELGRPVFYEFKDAKAVEEKQEEDQLHEDAAKVATLTSEYDELLEKENQALVSVDYGLSV